MRGTPTATPSSPSPPSSSRWVRPSSGLNFQGEDMTKTSRILAALVLGAAATAAAQGTPPAKPAAAPRAGGEERNPRIAVIDMAKVSSDSLLGRSYAGQL